MNFDLIYKTIGEFGPFQKYVVLLGALAYTNAGLLFISSFFILAVPKHRCAIYGLQNDSYAAQSEHHQYLINRSIPASDDPDFLYDRCSVYRDYASFDGRGPPTNGSTVACSRWVYDRSVFTSTLAAQLNIVCDRKILKSNGQMVFFAGLLLGSLITGMISDRFGRKRTLCTSAVLCVTAAVTMAWAAHYWHYLLLIFSIGFFAVGMFMSAFVMNMEFVGPTKRRFAGTAGSYFWLIGNLILAGLGYAIRDWSTLQLTIGVPGICFLLYWIIYPESARWLYSQGRREESERVIRKAARVNKVTLPEKFFDKVFVETEEIPQGRLWHLFSSRVLAVRTLIIMFIWFAVCISYYGLALNSGNLPGDLFLNFFIQALVDLPGNTLVLLLLNRTGRRPLMVGSMVLGGLSCIITMFSILYAGKDMQMVSIVFAMLGKMGAAAGFTMAYIYSAELYPTVVRNAGMGASSSSARVGGMIAPYVADMNQLVGGYFGKALPLIVFGVLSVCAGLLALFLPETLHKNLPESILDGERFGREDDSLHQADVEIHVNKAYDDSDGTETQNQTSQRQKT